MMLIRASRAGGWAGLTTAGASVISWQAGSLMLAALVVSGVLRLLTEWQRRKTLLALLSGAPQGSRVIRQDTSGGQLMKVSVGSSASRRHSARS
jgi:hypothetical protein